MSHPDTASDIQDAGQGSEPTSGVKLVPHQMGTNGEVVGNAKAKSAQTLEELEAQGSIGPLTPRQSTEVRSDVSSSRDYKRVALTQDAIAGLGAVAQGGKTFNDGRRKAS